MTSDEEPSAEVSITNLDEDENIQEILDALPEKVRARIVVTRSTQETVFSGPFPPPYIIAEYENAMPGAAERVFNHSEVEQANRHEVNIKKLDLEKHQIDVEAGKFHKGQNAGFATMVLLFVLAVIALYLDQPWITGLIAAIGVVLAVFVAGKKPKKRKIKDEEDE